MSMYSTAFVKDHLRMILEGVKLIVKQNEEMQKRLAKLEDQVNKPAKETK